MDRFPIILAAMLTLLPLFLQEERKRSLSPSADVYYAPPKDRIPVDLRATVSFSLHERMRLSPFVPDTRIPNSGFSTSSGWSSKLCKC